MPAPPSAQATPTVQAGSGAWISSPVRARLRAISAAPAPVTSGRRRPCVRSSSREFTTEHADHTSAAPVRASPDCHGVRPRRCCRLSGISASAPKNPKVRHSRTANPASSGRRSRYEARPNSLPNAGRASAVPNSPSPRAGGQVF